QERPLCAIVSTITGITFQSMRSLGNLIPRVLQPKDALSCLGCILSLASSRWYCADSFPGVHFELIILFFQRM
ncbi:mCG1046162, isoform CRA_a, partial [Mus musculus]